MNSAQQSLMEEGVNADMVHELDVDLEIIAIIGMVILQNIVGRMVHALVTTEIANHQHQDKITERLLKTKYSIFWKS